jgi:hypothetical protein
MLTKAIGTRYEQLFIVETLKKGLHPHDTTGDYLPHDIAVMNESGRFFRVQVKGASKEVFQKNGSPRYEMNLKQYKDGVKTKMTASTVDVFAAYLEPSDVWYLIPSMILSNISGVRFYPEAKGGSRSRLEKYRDNWDCFFLS